MICSSTQKFYNLDQSHLHHLKTLHGRLLVGWVVVLKHLCYLCLYSYHSILGITIYRKGSEGTP